MNVLEWGARGRPSVLLLHGAPGRAASFAPLADALTPRHRVFAVELPGYGKSAPIPAPHDFDAVSESIVNELARAGVREVAIIGHSLGGYRAFALALSGRITVTSIVTLGGFAGLDDPVRTKYRDLASYVRSGGDLAPIVRDGYLGPGAANHPEDVAEVLSWAEECSRETLASELSAVASAADLRPRLSRLECPVLARVGSVDPAMPVSMSEEIVKNASAGRLEVVEGAGHALLLEDREGTTAAVATFLAGS